MAEDQESGCIHRWALGEPEATGIQGVCRRCGASRTYPLGPVEVPELPPQDDAETTTHSTLVVEAPALEENVLA